MASLGLGQYGSSSSGSSSSSEEEEESGGSSEDERQEEDERALANKSGAGEEGVVKKKKKVFIPPPDFSAAKTAAPTIGMSYKAQEDARWRKIHKNADLEVPCRSAYVVCGWEYGRDSVCVFACV